MQVIYGPRVTVIRSELESYLSMHIDKASEDITLAAPLSGKLIPLEKVADDAFSQGILGRGAAIVPSAGEVYSPCDGKITQTFDSRHALGITSDEGVELLIHVGIDTVKLGGKYFEYKINAGERVKKGDLLMKFDLGALKAEKIDTSVPVVVCNTDSFPNIEVVGNAEIKHGENMIKIKA